MQARSDDVRRRVSEDDGRGVANERGEGAAESEDGGTAADERSALAKDDDEDDAGVLSDDVARAGRDAPSEVTQTPRTPRPPPAS